FTARVDGDLHLGSIQETVTVTGASPVVDTQNVRSQNVLSRDTLDALPTSKSYYAFATLTVGMTGVIAGGGQDVGGTAGDAYGYLTIHGSKWTDGDSAWDGMSFNDSVGTGRQKRYFVNQAAVREVVVSTGGMSPEIEGGGVNTNFVPKDGGNT